MNIWLENANLNNNNGPNSFAQKLHRAFTKKSFKVNQQPYNVSLCFIESWRHNIRDLPTIQRLDGIYYNTAQNYEVQNQNILRTYKSVNGIVFQSEFSKKLIFEWFGAHKNCTIIHNGADMDLINSIPALDNPILNGYENIWCCAASWRPHKRLQDNIKYFLEHSGPEDILFIAGDKQHEQIPKDSKIKYLGTLEQNQLIALYKASTHFIHLGWLDNCPNVIVDARACGCKIICTNSGGSAEIAGTDATIIEQEPWNFKPVELYNPPILDFSKKIKNLSNSEYSMDVVADSYLKFLKEASE